MSCTSCFLTYKQMLNLYRAYKLKSKNFTLPTKHSGILAFLALNYYFKRQKQTHCCSLIYKVIQPFCPFIGNPLSPNWLKIRSLLETLQKWMSYIWYFSISFSCCTLAEKHDVEDIKPWTPLKMPPRCNICTLVYAASTLSISVLRLYRIHTTT